MPGQTAGEHECAHFAQALPGQGGGLEAHTGGLAVVAQAVAHQRQGGLAHRHGNMVRLAMRPVHSGAQEPFGVGQRAGPRPAAHVGPANANNRTGGRAVLEKLHRQGFARLQIVLADEGYDGRFQTE